MVRQYPYILQSLTIADGGPDQDGNYQPATETWSDVCICRDEAGNGKKLTLADGSVHEYSYLVQMPKGTEPIDSGTKIRVMDGGEIRATGEVLYSRKDQLHSRLWV